MATGESGYLMDRIADPLGIGWSSAFLRSQLDEIRGVALHESAMEHFQIQFGGRGWLVLDMMKTALFPRSI